MKQTKIVATIGPSCDSYELLEELIRSGVDVFRFNFKHGEVEWHRERVQRVREVAKKMGVAIGTMMDLQGPSFRIILDTPTKQLHVGDRFELGSPVFDLTHPHIIPLLPVGQKLLLDDGTITFTVIEQGTSEKPAIIESQSDALLKTRKSLNIPGADFPVDLLTARDLLGIGIAVAEKMEIVAFSFARTAQDIRDVRQKLAEYGCTASVMAKLETVQSMDNLEEIVQETDSIMIARGDLGVEAPIEHVPVYQKRMIEMCMRYGKTVLTATQMLASMEMHKNPTRAEVSDVANAVIDGTDAVMLSGESAAGAYPVETVQMMTRTITYTENEGKKYLRKITKLLLTDNAARVAHAAFKFYEDCVTSGKHIDGFIVFSHSGRTARLISHFRPAVPIYTFSTNPLVVGALCVDYGVVPFIQVHTYHGEVEKDQVRVSIDYLKSEGHIEAGHTLIALHGDHWGALGGTSTMRIVEVT